ncbi:MAG TPA: radical SAM protein [Vicinamibacteria bacterium]|nr:radical SAM protein [Vicinamibacteria bacterium]
MAETARVDILEVILTAGCNLRCAYCYQNDKKPRSMSWDTLRGALDLLLRSRSNPVEVLFLGGEPLLEFPLIRQGVAYLDEARPKGKRVRYSIVTNGLLLREEQVRFLARHRFSTQLSFDGVPAAQDLRGHGTFETLDRLLDRLRAEHPAFFARRLSVGMTLTAATITHLADSVAYFLKKGVPEVSLSPVMTHDPGWKNEMIAVLDTQFARLFDACLRHYRRTGQVPLELFRKEGGDDPHAPRGDALCGAPSGRNLAVDVDGRIHGCAVFAESYQRFTTPFLQERAESIRIGDYRDPAFPRRLEMYPQAARAAGIFHDKREKYSSYGRCAECRFLDRCGICPASIGHIPGNSDPRRVPDFPCAYNLVSHEYRERFPAQPTPLDVVTGRVRAYGPLGKVQRLLLA